MLVLLRGQVLNIMTDTFVSRKSGETWYTVLYQVMTHYEGHPMAMENLQTMSASFEGPDEKMVLAAANREPVDILVNIRKDDRSETGLSARIVQVDPRVVTLQLTGNGSGRAKTPVAESVAGGK